MHDDFSDQTLKGPVRLLTLVTYVLKHYSVRSCSGQEVTNISLLYRTCLDIKSVRESRRRKEERYPFFLLWNILYVQWLLTVSGGALDYLLLSNDEINEAASKGATASYRLYSLVTLARLAITVDTSRTRWWFLSFKFTLVKNKYT